MQQGIVKGGGGGFQELLPSHVDLHQPKSEYFQLCFLAWNTGVLASEVHEKAEPREVDQHQWAKGECVAHSIIPKAEGPLAERC